MKGKLIIGYSSFKSFIVFSITHKHHFIQPKRIKKPYQRARGNDDANLSKPFEVVSF